MKMKEPEREECDFVLMLSSPYRDTSMKFETGVGVGAPPEPCHIMQGAYCKSKSIYQAVSERTNSSKSVRFFIVFRCASLAIFPFALLLVFVCVSAFFCIAKCSETVCKYTDIQCCPNTHTTLCIPAEMSG